jgi:hypothetical protein
MMAENTHPTVDDERQRETSATVAPTPADTLPTRPVEIGGVRGPDPTRYGDWERNGRCIDF